MTLLLRKPLLKKLMPLLHYATELLTLIKILQAKKGLIFLNAIADEILALDDTLVQMYCQETGLPEGRAKGERGRTIFQLQSFANLVSEGSWVDATIDVANPDRTPFPKSRHTKNGHSFRTCCVFWSE